MAHRRFEFKMPASAEVVFDAFHFHHWRHQWDSLVRNTRVVGGHPCPYKGAVTENDADGWLNLLSMRTQFVAFERPKVAAARMLGRSFPFARWAASMSHRSLGDKSSLLIYTYSFEVSPRLIRRFFEPLVQLVFDASTKRRFMRMKEFLLCHAAEIESWQRARE